MKTRFKYIQFKQVMQNEIEGKTKWICENNTAGFPLGWVLWYAPWRRYTFCPVGAHTVFSGGCLDDISSFLRGLNCGDKSKNKG